MRLNKFLYFGVFFLVTRARSNPVLNDEEDLFNQILTEEDNDYEYFDYGNDTANFTFSDQIMSDELWDYLTLEHDLEKLEYENYSDYSSDLFPQDFGSVYANRSNFRWSSNVIPYEIPYDLDEQTFDEDYQKRVENAIELLNFKLDGCIEFR